MESWGWIGIPFLHFSSSEGATLWTSNGPLGWSFKIMQAYGSHGVAMGYWRTPLTGLCDIKLSYTNAKVAALVLARSQDNP
jgi:hypothetical protein